MNQPSMTYRPLGRCGTKVSTFGLGGWTTFGGSVTENSTIHDILHRAFEAGINFFDIADIYAKGESERMMGKVLGEFPRHRLVISSKLFWPMSDDVNDRGLSRKHIMESVEKSLKRIGTDYLDIYFCHRYDDETPLEETARAMDDLIHQGKVLYWGTSEWSAAQIGEVSLFCQSKRCYAPQVEQPQYSLLARERVEREIRKTTEELGMGMVVWSPLASGLLTGKYDQGLPEGARLTRVDWLRAGILTEANLDKVRRLKKIADELGVTRSQLALAWTAAQPGISSVITGATQVAQLEDNLGALAIKITPELNRSISEIFTYA